MTNLQTAYLLGAGASVEAGVPASTEMTEKIVELVDTAQNRFSKVSQALNYAVGALMAHDTARGSSPFAGIDVERLFAAVQMLRNKDELEVAPFVQWSPVLDSMTPENRFPPTFDRELKSAMTGERQTYKSASDVIKEAITSMVGSADSGRTFERLESAMVLGLRQVLRVIDKDVGYLSPILDGKGTQINIASLNYDRSVEILCTSSKRALDTGIENWAGGYDWSWDPGAEVRLQKLHGSIDWVLDDGYGVAGLRESRVRQVESLAAKEAHLAPAIVFGSRGKVRAQGPFLAMLGAFDKMLESTDRLVVVGYSFRDDHINVAIRRWANSHPDGELTVIDPSFGEDKRVATAESFAWELQRASTPKKLQEGNRPALKLRVIAEKASVGLRSLASVS